MTSSHTRNPAVRNWLLAALAPEALERMLPNLHPVPFALRETLYPPEGAIDAVYFPESGWASLVATLDEGTQTEVGIIGREGMVGMPLAFGIDHSFNEAVVQGQGTALRMGAGAFRHALGENPELQNLLFRYNEALQTQISQNVACNRWHELEQRLARWLLMAHDRTDGDELPLTHNFLAMMLGVHRPSVSVTARILQRAGLIRYASGMITVVDRQSPRSSVLRVLPGGAEAFERLLGRPVS